MQGMQVLIPGLETHATGPTSLPATSREPACLGEHPMCCNSDPGGQFSHSVMSDPLQLHGLQHTRLPCPSPAPKDSSTSCPSSRWCHPTISSSIVPFSSCLQSFPASGSFPVSQFFAPGVQSVGVSAWVSDLPMNIQDWFPLGWTGWISTCKHS